MDIFAGQLIKGYELQERIAAGGFGAVYRAYQSTVGREVAIKVILPNLANKPEFIRRFDAEAQLIARLEHMNIVPLYDYWRDPDGAFLVMRYLRGGSLRDYVRKYGSLNIEDAFNLFAQIAQGLHVAHRNQVIHRDIKPGNILLDEDGNGYLSDFGIAKDYTTTHSITEPDSFIGSPEYLAPEQARSEPVTPRTDTYSLGVVLYEMLTGEHPFSGVDKITFIYKHLNDPLPEITLLDTNICNDINEVVQKATAKNPQHRFGDVIEMTEALRHAAKLDVSPTPTNLVELLTPREQEVMQLIIDGKSNREIADLLVLAEGTVKQYITSIYRKLNVRSRVQAIARARDLNFVISKPTVHVTTGHLPEPENPYKGLRAFQAADEQDFFGREKLTQKLLVRLSEKNDYQRFLAVVGPSGSGKSSVVKAGLVPALWRGELSGSENWYIIDMLPGPHPIDELEVALFQIATDKSLNLREQLERDKRGLIRVASMILPDNGSELLLVIDQFEEVFTLLESEDERLQFLALLQLAVTDKRSRVRVVVTLRADYYDRPLQYPEFGEMMRNRVETVLPLSAEGLERAISEPAHRQGVTFEDGLVTLIVSDIHYQPGALPLLQYALTELFERRDKRKLTHAAYEAVGRTGGALANRADEIYLELEENGREAIRQLYLRLVTLGEGAEDTRRRVVRSELLDISADKELMDEVIDLYTVSRLLSLDNDPTTRQPTVEVAHEAILREWERLRQWLNECREDIRQERLVAQSADAWHNNNFDKSYLLTGSHLETVQKWLERTELALTKLEDSYIQTSIEEAKAKEIAETVRQEREVALERRSQTVLRALVGVFAAAAFIAILLSIVAVRAGDEAAIERDNAQENFRRAERIRLASQARALLESGENTELVALLALRSLTLGYSPEADKALLQAYSSGFPIQTYEHTNAISGNSGVLSADGQYYFVGSNDNTILMWNVQTGEVDYVFSGHREWVAEVTLTADGKRLLSSSGDGTVRVWDIESGQTLFTLPDHGAEITTVALSTDESVIITGDTSGLVRQWDYETQTLQGQFPTFDADVAAIMSLVLTPNGQRVITGSCDNTARLWDLATGTELIRFEGHAACIRQVTLTPDGNYLVTASYDNTARLWDIATGQALIEYRGHSDRIEAVEVSPDGRYLMTGSWDRTARLWDLATGETLRIFRGQPDIYGRARFLPDAKQIVISSFNRIQVWDIATPAEPAIVTPQNYRGHSSNAIDIQFIDSDRQLFSVTTSGQVTHWDVATRQEFPVEMPELPLSEAAVYLEDANRFVNAASDGFIQIWNYENKHLLREFNDPTGQLRQIDVNEDATFLVSVGGDNVVRLWDIATGSIIKEFEGHDAEILSVALSEDGARMITGGVDQTARVWNVKTGELLHTLDGHAGIVTTVSISSDGFYGITGSEDTFVVLWNIETGEQIRRFTGLNATVGSVALSTDRELVVGGASNGTAILWDIESGAIIRQFTGQLTAIDQVDITDDGKYIAISDLTSVYFWRTNLDDIIALVCSQLSRDFTAEERITYSIPDTEATCTQTTLVEAADFNQQMPVSGTSSSDATPLQITPQYVSNSEVKQPSAVTQSEAVFWFATGLPVGDSFATLTRTTSGVAMTYAARELTPGDAVTIWWVIWDRPELCTPPICSPDDVFATDEMGNYLMDDNRHFILNQAQIDTVGISLLYATGNIVKEGGTAQFNAFLPVGDRLGKTTFGSGLLNSFTTEIHLVARTHGQASADLSILQQQLNTDWGGCEPYHPPCNDLQAAVFMPVNP